MNYLMNMPSSLEDYGVCKTLVVRREMIHIKHILTEIFIRKTIDIEKLLSDINMSLFDYIEHITQKIRHLYKIDRQYKYPVNELVNYDRGRFFPMVDMFSSFNSKIILDFDGVVTDKNFKELYELCIQRCSTCICSANPTITEDYFHKHTLSLPKHIFANKGKLKKLKQLLNLNLKNDFLFFIDDEILYLTYAWIFGINTYYWNNKQIKLFSLNSK